MWNILNFGKLVLLKYMHICLRKPQYQVPGPSKVRVCMYAIECDVWMCGGIFVVSPKRGMI